MDTQEEQHLTQEVPAGQKFFDNIVLLFIVSMLISMVIYNLWGIIEVLTVPLHP